MVDDTFYVSEVTRTAGTVLFCTYICKVSHNAFFLYFANINFNYSKQMNVSSACIDACSFHLDMDNIMDRPECMNDFDKLMKCAADGSGNYTQTVFF